MQYRCQIGAEKPDSIYVAETETTIFCCPFAALEYRIIRTVPFSDFSND